MRPSVGHALRHALAPAHCSWVSPLAATCLPTARTASSSTAQGVTVTDPAFPAKALRRPRLNLDLPKENEQKRFRLVGKMDSTLGTEAEKERSSISMASITPEDIAAQWPPPGLVDPLVGQWPPTSFEVPKTPIIEPVKRPNLWLNSRGTEDPPDVGIEDAGRFLRLDRDELVELLPEGACGELSRDLTLIPSRKRDLGLMLRKPAIELIYQLSKLQHATDARKVPRIKKAGFLLDGHKGTGKSQVLNTIAMWARRNGWLVVMEPVPSRYSKEIAEIKRSNAGVYIQNEFSQAFLETTASVNREMFEEIPVDLASYGSCAIDGEPVKQTQRLYEPLIEKTVEQEVAEKGLSPIERLHRIAAYKKQVRMPSMAEHLRRPSTVYEIIEFGLQNEAYASQAVAELFVQLQRQITHPVLVIVDEWNECFPVSQYVSVRYDNTRFHGYIPAYHLTMPRALHRWDGHLYRRGLKICATSWMRFKRRDYRPDLLGVKDYEIRTVRNFSQHEFANFVTYYRLMNILHNFPREDLEYYYMLTQGNPWQARRLLTTLY